MSKVPGIDIVGIAAPTCAGKTTLIENLKTKLPAASFLSFDEYDLYPTGSEAMEQELAEPSITNWEDPALFDMDTYVEHLGQIAEGNSVDLQTRSRESLNRAESRRLFVTSSLNIVEGVFAFYDRRAQRVMDLSIFIDIPLEVMVERRLAASRGGEGPWDDPHYITGQMIEGTRHYIMPQRQYADVVLDGTLAPRALAMAVLDQINRL